MRIIAVDPGETIGLALWDTDDSTCKVHQVAGTYAAGAWIEHNTPDIVLVENYLGSGALTKEAKTTVMRVGFFSEWAMYMDWETYLVAPQKRLSAVSQATELIGPEALKAMYRNGRDAVAALAHALAWSRENL